MNGGAGIDTATYAAATGAVTVNLGTGTASGAAGNDTLATIENLVGSAYADTLTGSAGANLIAGGAGNDLISAGEGDDFVYGNDGLDVVTLGAGNDTFIAEVTATKEVLRTGTMSVDIITDFDALGDDVIDLSGLGTPMTFLGTNANKNMGDLTYKTYTSISGAENALGIEIDGRPGAGGVSGPVTVVYGNTDGGKADFAIILLNTSSVDASDFDFDGAASVASISTSSIAGAGSDFDGPVSVASASMSESWSSGDYFMV